MRGSRLVWLGVLVLVLGACAPITAVPTETATLRPSATVSETLEATSTTLLTQTATFAWTPFPTFTPLPYRTPQGEFIRSVEDYSFSPDGKWVAWSLCCTNTGYHMLVEEINGTRQYQEQVDFETSLRGERFYLPLTWSSDGKYLYYGVYPALDGGCAIYRKYAYLMKMNLQTGLSTAVLTSGDPRLLDFSISPSETKVAYTLSNPGSIQAIVFAFADSSEVKIDIEVQPSTSAGHILWSPGGKKLAFATCNIDADTFSIIMVDLIEMTYKKFLEDSIVSIQPIEWENGNLIIQYWPYGQERQLLELNIETGELTPATPQP